MRKQQKLKSKLRFSEYEGKADDSYKSKLFEDVFAFSTGMNIKQAEASPDFATPCVRYGELYHMYNEVITTVINRTNIDPSELKFSDGDEILLPSAGEDPFDIGSASALTIKGVAIGRTINILKPKNANVYDQRFASYYINQKLRKKISTLARGASISNVYNSDLKQLEIVLPPLPEQRKIADFLTAVDGRIQQLSQKLALLQDYKKGVMQQLFTQALRFKDDHGNEFPDWEEKKAKDVFVRHSNKNHASDLPILSASQELGMVPREDNGIQIQATAESVASYKVVEVGDFVISLRSFQGGIERSAMTGICSPAYTTMKACIPIDGHFYKYFLKTDSFIQRLSNTVVGIRDGKQISYDAFGTLILPVPSVPEQTKIANFLTALDRKIESVAHQIAHTQSFKKGLLQQMFV